MMEAFSPVIDRAGNTSSRRVMISSQTSAAVTSSDVAVARGGEVSAVDSGVSSFLFEWPTSFQDMLDLSWMKLMFGYVMIVTAIAFVVAVLNFFMCRNCGAQNCDFVGSFLFAAVSLSSNGGYTGEDPIMLTWRTTCFPWRTNLIFVSGITGTLIVSVGAAVVVGKASRHTALGDRICIATSAVVHRLAAAKNSPLVVEFRLANVHRRPLFNVSVSLTAVVVRPAHASSRPDASPGGTDIDVDMEQLHVSCVEERIHAADDVGEGDAAATSSTQRAADVEVTVRSQNLNAVPLPCNMWYPITITHWVGDPSSPVSRLIAAEGGLSEAMANGLQFVLQVTGQDPLNGANIVVRKAFNKENTLFGCRYNISKSLVRSVRTGASRTIFVDLEHFNSVDALEQPEHKGSFQQLPPSLANNRKNEC